MSTAGRRAGQLAVDWARMATRITEEGRARFNQLRSRYETCKAGMNSYPEKPHPIDWSYYRSSASASGIVDSFQKQYEAVTVPYPKDTASASIEKREREVEVVVQETLVKSKEKVKEWEAEIEEYLVDKPELKKMGDEMTRKQEWGALKD